MRGECNNCHSADGHVAVRRGLRCVVAGFEASPYLVNDSGDGTFARKINGVSSSVHPRGDAAACYFRSFKISGFPVARSKWIANLRTLGELFI